MSGLGGSEERGARRGAAPEGAEGWGKVGEVACIYLRGVTTPVPACYLRGGGGHTTLSDPQTNAQHNLRDQEHSCSTYASVAVVAVGTHSCCTEFAPLPGAKNARYFRQIEGITGLAQAI